MMTPDREFCRGVMSRRDPCKQAFGPPYDAVYRAKRLHWIVKGKCVAEISVDRRRGRARLGGPILGGRYSRRPHGDAVSVRHVRY